MYSPVPTHELVQLEKNILDRKHGIDLNLPLIAKIFQDDVGGSQIFAAKIYMNIVLNAAGYKGYEFILDPALNVVHNEMKQMYKQYMGRSSCEYLSEAGGILILSFQGNVDELIPRYHLCNTPLVPRYAGFGVYRFIKELGYNVSLVQFRDCVQMWYEDKSLTNEIIGSVEKAIKKLHPSLIVFMGGSAGGFAAIKYFLLCDRINNSIPGFKLCIANGPQCDVFTSRFSRAGAYGESYRKLLWSRNKEGDLGLGKYLNGFTVGAVVIFFGDQCEEDCTAIEQMAHLGVFSDPRISVRPMRAKIHAPARKKHVAKEILSVYHKFCA